MTTICSWCEQEGLVTAPVGEVVSHGICDLHSARMLAPDVAPPVQCSGCPMCDPEKNLHCPKDCELGLAF